MEKTKESFWNRYENVNMIDVLKYQKKAFVLLKRNNIFMNISGWRNENSNTIV